MAKTLTEERNEFLDGIKNALVDFGAMLENWKINLICIENDGSDIYYVSVTITKNRCKKPFVMWTLRVDTVRELVYFDRSTFEYL